MLDALGILNKIFKSKENSKNKPEENKNQASSSSTPSYNTPGHPSLGADIDKEFVEDLSSSMYNKTSPLAHTSNPRLNIEKMQINPLVRSEDTALEDEPYIQIKSGGEEEGAMNSNMQNTNSMTNTNASKIASQKPTQVQFSKSFKQALIEGNNKEAVRDNKGKQNNCKNPNKKGK